MKKNKQLEKQIEQTWYKLASGVQVSIMSIPLIFRDCEQDVTKNGLSVEQAVLKAIAKYEHD